MNRMVDVISKGIDTTFNHKLGLVFRNMCAKFCFSILSRCDVIDADVKGGNNMPPSGRRVARSPSGRRVNMQIFTYYVIGE